MPFDSTHSEFLMFAHHIRAPPRAMSARLYDAMLSAEGDD